METKQPEQVGQTEQSQLLQKYIHKFKAMGLKIKKLIYIFGDTDYDSTTANISKSVEFKGTNIWILFFATILASIGLNVNSTAVIIGAMLISPLMGPINGIGLAVGTYDGELLKKSLRNLGLMVVISLFASTLYFIASPLSDAQSELLARTRPTIFDVLIAFFGGCAGFIASSRKDQSFTVISGVAIATALMPPLCTAGFGLATLQLKYFFGAFYLFFINSVFIALATFILTKYLKFPLSNTLNPTSERLVKRSIIIFALLVTIPSLFMAINVVKETSFNSQTIKFVNEIQKKELFKDTQIINYKKEYSRKGSTLHFFLVGKELSNEEIDTLRKVMVNDFGLINTQLTIKQTSQVIDVNMQTDVLENMLTQKSHELSEKEQQIQQLAKTIEMMKQHHQSYQDKATVIGRKYKENIATIAISDISFYNTESGKNDTIPTIYIQWKENMKSDEVKKDLENWAPLLMNVEEVCIID